MDMYHKVICIKENKIKKITEKNISDTTFFMKLTLLYRGNFLVSFVSGIPATTSSGSIFSIYSKSGEQLVENAIFFTPAVESRDTSSLNNDRFVIAFRKGYYTCSHT
jgi:hypothetical protein